MSTLAFYSNVWLHIAAFSAAQCCGPSPNHHCPHHLFEMGAFYKLHQDGTLLNPLYKLPILIRPHSSYSLILYFLQIHQEDDVGVLQNQPISLRANGNGQLIKSPIVMQFVKCLPSQRDGMGAGGPVIGLSIVRQRVAQYEATYLNIKPR